MPDVLYFVRRDADSGGKLSTSTIVIIAVVSGCVVVLVLALFAWRLLARSCRRSKKVPLPPVQDLAHHREQQLSAFTDRNARPTTWVDPPGSSIHQPHPRLYSSHFLSASASSASLIRHGSSPDFASTASRGPTRENSWGVEDATSAESSPYPLSTEELMPPNPSFLPVVGANPHTSMTSVASSSSDAISDANAALPTSPSEQTHSVESSVSLANNANSNSPYGSPVRARPPRASRSRSRPMSIVSSNTNHSLQTSHSINTLRGPAHSIHSNIQIVLPAPLAPELYPQAEAQMQAHPLADAGGLGFERMSSFYGGGDRRSVADQWLLAGSRPQSMARIDREASSGSPRMSSAGPRASHSRTYSGHGPRTRSSLHKVASLPESDSASAKARRAQSQPPLPSAPSAPAVARARARTPSPGPSRPPRSSFAQPASPLPPVPRIPSQYGRAGSVDSGRDSHAYGGSNGYGHAYSNSNGNGYDHGYDHGYGYGYGSSQGQHRHGDEPTRGRARETVPLPMSLPAGAAAPVPMGAAPPAPVPQSYMHPAGPRREPSGRLRKTRASSRS